jgi:hypothetical protein
MASDTICLGERQACAIRATRLNEDCTVAEGEDNAVVTAALVTLTASPEVEEGTSYQPKNACDDIRWTAEEPDNIIRYTGDGELSDFDNELIELLTDAALLTGATGTPWEGMNIGRAMPGPDTPAGAGVALEIWVKNAVVGSGGGPCGPAGTHPPFTRYVFPKVTVRPGDRTFSIDAGTFAFAIKASPNPNWGEGPWGDWQPAESMPEDAPYAAFWDDALPETGCGYIEVPAGS